MKRKYQYKNIKTNEVVEDFMTEEYVLNELGITIEPKGKIDWFFSGNWIKEEVEE